MSAISPSIIPVQGAPSQPISAPSPSAPVARLTPGYALTIAAKDGFALGATVFPATGDGLLVIHSATAVPQTFYAAFAEYMAERGVTVVTYDYRGVGRSRPPGPLLRVVATMRIWAEQDATAVMDWAAAQFPGRRFMVLGHSFGGQILGLLPNRHLIERTLLVASQLGYWGAFTGRDRRRAWFGMHVLMPALTHALGYFPGSKVGLGEDLPKGVALEWARWCRSPHYLFDYVTPAERAAYDAFAAPMLAFKFTDDSFASGDSVERLLAFYRKARPVLRTINPRDVGLKHVGHFGFFRTQSRDVLWPEAAEWLTASTATKQELAG
jgi:predicted alpha/beta hydrolase